MFIIKPIAPEDARAIEKFMSYDLLGITSLPRNKHFLHQKLNSSLTSFSKEIDAPQNEQYYFVLENIQTGEIGGICGIESKTGVESPLYSYRIEKVSAPETDLPVPRKQLILHFNSQQNGPTKIGSLYILPSFRKERLGRLLSLSRFLFMASFPHRFEGKVTAEMRGLIDEKHISPFWNGLGKHFINIEFNDLMDTLDEIKDSIPLISPKYPIYVSLLPNDAQDAIGRVHLDTQPALNLLMQEGFTLTNEIDLFDAGPKIEAATEEIRSFKYSQTAIVKKFSTAPIDSDRYIISNQKLNFRSCYGQLNKNEDGSIVLTTEVGHALGIQEGDKVRYVICSTKTSSREA